MFLIPNPSGCRSSYQGLGGRPSWNVLERETYVPIHHTLSNANVQTGTLTIPANKAYGNLSILLPILSHAPQGSRGFGSVIPPNSVLVFTVELVGLNSGRDEL